MLSCSSPSYISFLSFYLLTPLQSPSPLTSYLPMPPSFSLPFFSLTHFLLLAFTLLPLSFSPPLSYLLSRPSQFHPFLLFFSSPFVPFLFLHRWSPFLIPLHTTIPSLSYFSPLSLIPSTNVSPHLHTSFPRSVTSSNLQSIYLCFFPQFYLYLSLPFLSPFIFSPFSLYSLLI